MCHSVHLVGDRSVDEALSIRNASTLADIDTAIATLSPPDHFSDQRWRRLYGLDLSTGFDDIAPRKRSSIPKPAPHQLA